MQQFSRNNNSAQTNSLKDLLQNKIDDMEKQVLSRVNTLEESKLGQKNETEQRGRVESTLTSLHHRITDLEKGKLPTESRKAHLVYVTPMRSIFFLLLLLLLLATTIIIILLRF